MVLAILGININQVPNNARTNPANGAGSRAPHIIVAVNTPSGEKIKNQRGYMVLPLRMAIACHMVPRLNAMMAVRSPIKKCWIAVR